MPVDIARVQTVFAAAAEISDPAARAAFLTEACGNDLELKSRVEALLRALDQPDSFLDSPLVAPPHSKFAATSVFPSKPDAATLFSGGGDNSSEEEPLTFLGPATRPDSLGRLGHYEVLQVLGRGGFGIVFRAFDDVLQRVVAVKVMAPQLAATSPARKRFLREARTSAAVRHESVVQIYEVAEQPVPYLVMEFIPGETLQQKLDRTGPLEIAEVVRIGLQIAEGLAAAHACDMIHRDIKPGNLLIDAGQQRVKITDFGLARAADDASMTQSGIIAGTPMYMAPEQALGHKLDQRADLFSLGSVLYQMVSGRPPFRAPSTLAVLKRVAEEPPRPIQQIIPETPTWLSDIISKLHAKNPDDRYQSAREVADVLADCEAQLKSHGKVTDSSLIPSVKPRQSGRWKWVAAAALLVPLIALGVVAFNRPRQPIQTADDSKADPQGPITPPVEKKSQSQAEDPDRVAAAYVLSVGGTIRVNGQDQEINADAGLPTEAFQLTSVDLGNNKKVSDQGLAAFKDCRNVTHLLLYSTPVGDEGVAYFKNCTNLMQIDLNDTQVGDAGSAYLKDCKNLTHLGLAGSRAGNACLAHVKGGRNLMYLYLHITQVSDAGLSDLKDCANLTKVTLDRTKVTAKGIGELKKALPGCTIIWDGGVEPGTNPDPDRRAAMHVLRLGGAVQVNEQVEFIEDVAKLPRERFRLRTVHLMGKQPVIDADLAQFKDCKNLSDLMLSGCGELSDAGMAHLKDLKHLVSLGLDGTKVTDKGLVNLADFNGLKYLSLSSTQVSDAGLVYFKNCKDLFILDLNVTQVRGEGLVHFKDCKGLTKICLAQTKVGDSGLAHVKDCKNLVTLYFVGMQIGDEGLLQFKDCENLRELNLAETRVNGAVLADFKSRTRLEFIDLSNSQLNNEGIAHLKECKNLAFLSVLNTSVSDAGLVHLKDLKNLKTLNLQQTKVTAEGFASLKKALPDCNIEWKSPIARWNGWPTDGPAAAIAPFDAKAARAHQEAWAKHLGVKIEYANSIGMKFILIPPGEFMMGSTPAEIETVTRIEPTHVTQFESEGPQHKVILTTPFFLGIHDATQKNYQAVMGANPSYFSSTGAGKDKVAGLDTGNHPVENLDPKDVFEFCSKLSEQEKLKPCYARVGETISIINGTGYRLPTDAEWEFACRAGTTSRYWIGDKDEELRRTDWIGINSGGRTHPVGELPPNPFGLFDVHGNVVKVMQDWWAPNYYGQFKDKPAVDPRGPSTGAIHVGRGSNYSWSAWGGRSSARRPLGGRGFLTRGFRIVLSVEAVQRAVKE